MKAKLVASMKSLGSLPRGFFTAGATFDPETGVFTPHGDGVEVSHLSAVFGLPEIAAELIQNFGDEAPEFEKAWLQYCELYSAPADEQRRELGTALRGNGLTGPHSRLTAYAARSTNDPALAARAWKEFLGYERRPVALETVRVTGPAVLSPVDEAAWVSTNDAAQWSLAAIENLALIGDSIPQSG
jgi:hypothetical protein